ncbi:MAG: YdcF family protein, partial [Halioglobus sp.]|nr:YdcF family protein [Halioglobus sp.]
GYTPRALSVLEKADAIVLLGGGTRGYTHMGRLADLNQHADRLVHAAELYKADKAPVILLSGGAPRGDKHEAGQMRDVLRVMGVPAKAMLLETQSRNTAENAQFSGQLLRDRDLQRVLLVTSAFHMRRAERLFRAEGLQVIPAPTDFQRLVVAGTLPGWLPGVDNLARSTNALHEIAGYLVYQWQGRFDSAPAARASQTIQPSAASALHQMPQFVVAVAHARPALEGAVKTVHLEVPQLVGKTFPR